MNTVGMVSLGCAKNRVDAEMMLASLRDYGFKIIEDVALADCAIVNTCGFIEDAKKESIDEILELAQLKREGQIKAIVVTGCLAERYNTEMMKQLYEVDAVLGIGGNENIGEVVEKALRGEKTELFPDKMLLPLEGKRIQSTPKQYAYIKISEGCSNNCAYCAIPKIRGKMRSRTIEHIKREAKDLFEKGVKELIVIAQDTSRYGLDNYKKLMLPTLLKELCKIDFKWIRVLYCYPECITDELLKVMSEEEKIVNYLDIPLQHCNETVLKNMNRKGSKESFLSLVNKIRDYMPDATIRTTFIAGFPGETEEQFEELCEFVKEAKFQRVGCFPYSKEEDTPAYSMPCQLDEETKNHRAEIIMDTQSYIMDEFSQSLVGKELEILCEGYDRYAECYYGRSYMDAPEVDTVVFFSGEKKPSVGDFVKVKITDTLDGDLVGEII